MLPDRYCCAFCVCVYITGAGLQWTISLPVVQVFIHKRAKPAKDACCHAYKWWMDVSAHLCPLHLLSFPYPTIKLTIDAENRSMKGNLEQLQKNSLVLQGSHSLRAKSTWVSLGANKNTTDQHRTKNKVTESSLTALHVVQGAVLHWHPVEQSYSLGQCKESDWKTAGDGCRRLRLT